MLALEYPTAQFKFALGPEDALARLNASMGDLIDDVKPRHEHRRVFDLAVAYEHRAELEHGWWQRDRRITEPYDGHFVLSPPQRKHYAFDHTHYARRTEAWLVRLSDFAALHRGARLFVIDKEHVPDWLRLRDQTMTVHNLRSRLTWRTNFARLRRRLSAETGYDELHTPEECLDASRVYPAGSVAGRFCVALAEFCGETAR